jgi:hypothetical protein
MTAQEGEFALPTASFAQSAIDAFVLMTYSSTSTGIPSRLSSMAFEAGMAHFQAITRGQDERPPFVIASEQSWAHIPYSTGDLLVARRVVEHTDDRTRFEVVNGKHRLLHTIPQVRAAVDHVRSMTNKSEPNIRFLAWDFHKPRVEQAIKWQGIEPHVTSLNSIANYLWGRGKNRVPSDEPYWVGKERHNFQSRFGFYVDWEDLKPAFDSYEEREVPTRMVQSLAHGLVLAGIRNSMRLVGLSGRMDDISPFGTPIMKHTH